VVEGSRLLELFAQKKMADLRPHTFRLGIDSSDLASVAAQAGFAAGSAVPPSPSFLAFF